MNETINLLAFVITIVVVVGTTLFGVYKVVSATEQRSNSNIDKLRKDLINLNICIRDKKNDMENHFQEQITEIKEKQARFESDLQDMDRIFEEINAIKETIKDIYDKINSLTNKIIILLEKK